jgi:hypothetical protein
MKKFKIMLIAFIASLFFLTACEKDEVVPAAETAKKEETTTDQATADKQTEQEKKNTSEEQENEKAQWCSKYGSVYNNKFDKQRKKYQ